MRDPKRQAAGLTGFNFTLGREALKAAVCASPGLGKVAEPEGEGGKMDKRVIRGFRLYMTRVAGAACTDQNLAPVMTLTVFCKTPKSAKVQDRRGREGLDVVSRCRLIALIEAERPLGLLRQAKRDDAVRFAEIVA